MEGAAVVILDRRKVASSEDIEEGCLSACTVATTTCCQPVLLRTCSSLSQLSVTVRTAVPASAAPSSCLRTTASCLYVFYCSSHPDFTAPSAIRLQDNVSATLFPVSQAQCNCPRGPASVFAILTDARTTRVSSRRAGSHNAESRE